MVTRIFGDQRRRGGGSGASIGSGDKPQIQQDNGRKESALELSSYASFRVVHTIYRSRKVVGEYDDARQVACVG